MSKVTYAFIMSLETEQQAAIELTTVIDTWEKIISDLSEDKTRQISPEDGNRIRQFFYQEEQRFHIFYNSAYSKREFGLKVDIFTNAFGARLDVALLDGERRYDNAMHQRKIETIEAWGKFLNDIKFNIVALIIGLLPSIYFLFTST
jgi:hypothetical protein